MSKMIKCKSCSKEIASNAKSCPSCGAKNKKPFYKRGWFIALVIIIILGTIGESENNDTTSITDSEITKEEQVSNEENHTTEEAVEAIEEEVVESKDVEVLSYESVKSQAIAMLEKSFGKNGEIRVYEEDNIVLFSVPSPEGIAEGIFAINSGVANDELIESYEYMKESFMGLSETLYDLGQTCGMNFALGLQNNRNPDNLLLTILNGIVIDEVAEY